MSETTQALELKTVTMPTKAGFLREPHRYKAMYGGRDAIKSWSMAQQLVIDGATRSLRNLCTREVQETVKESVHLLLTDQINRLGLGGYYKILSNAIYGATEANKGTRFVYTGLRSLCNDKTALKAYESYDRVWVEEAQTMSAASIRTLIPTMRKAGSELWFSFNPDLETDPIAVFCFKNPPPELVKGKSLVKTSWRDNLWLTEESRRYIEHLRETDPEAYEEDYEGKFKSRVKGAVFAKELSKIVERRQERSVPHDPSMPVFTYWDIGDHYTAVWFVQHFPLEYHLIDYRLFELDSLPEIFRQLHQEPYNYARHVMTRDAASPQLATGESIEQQAIRLGGAGRILVLGVTTVKAQIASARAIFPLCFFDMDKCADGLNALRHYRCPDASASGAEHDKPLHDWASHGGSAFQTFAVGSKLLSDGRFEPPPPPPPQRPKYYSPESWMA